MSIGRRCWAVPAETKNAEATTKAFEDILLENRRKPSELDTDGGIGFTGGTFELFLGGNEIFRKVRAPGHANALAVINPFVRSLKEKPSNLVKNRAEDGSLNFARTQPCWHTAALL